MPVISDEDYSLLQQVKGGGDGGVADALGRYKPGSVELPHRAPDNAGLGGAYKAAVDRLQLLAGDRFQYDPSTNTVQPNSPTDATAAPALASAWQQATTGQPGSPPPVMTGGGYGAGGSGPTPERQAFLANMRKQWDQSGMAYEFIPSNDAGGGYFRSSDPRASTEQLTKMSTAAQAPPAPPLASPTPQSPSSDRVQAMSQYMDLTPPPPQAMNQPTNTALQDQARLRAFMATPGVPNSQQAVVSRAEVGQRQYAAPVQNMATGSPTLPTQGFMPGQAGSQGGQSQQAEQARQQALSNATSSAWTAPTYQPITTAQPPAVTSTAPTQPAVATTAAPPPPSPYNTNLNGATLNAGTPTSAPAPGTPYAGGGAAGAVGPGFADPNRIKAIKSRLFA
jgi:hypothetical protein